MKKVKGYGFLHGKNYGTIKVKDGITYDKNLDQYRYGNQWLIPFHRYENQKIKK